MRYDGAMLLVAAAVLAASAPAAPQAQAALAVRAQATIRILSSARYREGADRSEDGRPARPIKIRNEDGTRVPAKVVEFE